MDNKKIDYRSSGVNIDAGNEFVRRIKPLTKSTFIEGVVSDIGGFGGFFRLPTGLKNPLLVATTDGVGTKLKVAFDAGIHTTIGIDLVAMCANDLIATGATPLFFLDYFATGALTIEQGVDVVKGITEGCREAEMALIGGETAEMPGFYKNGEYDIAGFAVGVVEEAKVLPSKDIRADDCLIGIASNGLHSNGYSLARKLFFDELLMSVEDDFPGGQGQSVGNVLLRPTRIYVKLMKSLLKSYHIKAVAHITGGGFIDNIPRVLPDMATAIIEEGSWEMPDVFRFIVETGKIEKNELYRTFNMGIGLVLVVSRESCDDVLSLVKACGDKGWKIGRIERGEKEVVIR